MGKQHLSRDDRIFMRGKLQGTRENMDMVAMVLMDKCGWHVQEETSDSRDTHSIAYLYECLEKLAEEINEGRIERKHIMDLRLPLVTSYNAKQSESGLPPQAAHDMNPGGRPASEGAPGTEGQEASEDAGG